MSTLDLAALEAAIAKMSPAPWAHRWMTSNVAPFEDYPTPIVVSSHGAFPARISVDAAGIVALRNAAPLLLSRIRELEAQAAKTDEVLASAAAKWEEMERCAYNICAHCKEPFERGDAMSLHAQECPRNPVTMLNRAQAERIAALEGALGEALRGWVSLLDPDLTGDREDLATAERLSALLSGSKGVAE